LRRMKRNCPEYPSTRLSILTYAGDHDSLPGEFATIKAFCRDDVKAVSGSADRLQRIENWEERIFLYGKVIYRDLMEPLRRLRMKLVVLPVHSWTPEERPGDGGDARIQPAYLAGVWV